MDSLAKERVCGKCIGEFPLIEGLVCQKCGVPLSDGGEFCYACRKNKAGFSFEKMRSAYLYKDSIRSLILKFKYSSRTFLAKDLGVKMAEELQKHDFFNDTDFIVPVPLSITRRIKRGYNQAALLADVISTQTDLPVLNGVLYRKKITKPQFKLSKKERFENMKGSFFANDTMGTIKGKNILLIDDIATTASTASACSAALKHAGAKKVYVFTLARD